MRSIITRTAFHRKLKQLSDVSGVRGDIEKLKDTEIPTIKTDVFTAKTDISQIKTDISNAKSGIDKINSDISINGSSDAIKQIFELAEINTLDIRFAHLLYKIGVKDKNRLANEKDPVDIQKKIKEAFSIDIDEERVKKWITNANPKSPVKSK